MIDDFVQIDRVELKKKLLSLTTSEKRYILEVLQIYLSDGALTCCPDEISDE